MATNGKELVPAFTEHTLATVEHQVSRYASDQEVADIIKEGARQIAAEQMQAAKTKTAIALANEVYDHALATAEAFKKRAYKRLEEERSPDHQADYEALHDSLMARYNSHLLGIVEVGVTAMAREVHKDVIVPRPERRGWFR